MTPRGRRRSQQASVESSGTPNYEENFVERLAQSRERNGFTGSMVDQARRLRAVGHDGATDPMVALSWLGDTEKILDEGMQCPDEDRVRIAGFLLGGNAKKWWAYERTRKRHTWAQFKAAFHIEFCPPAFTETKRLEFETLTQGSFSSRSSSGRGSSGDRRGADGSRFQRGGLTHSFGFQSVGSGSSHFQRSAGRSGFRSTCGVCGKIHAGPCQWDNVCFQCGQIGHFRRDCPNRGSSQTKVSESGAQFQRASGHGGLNTQAGHTLSGSFSTGQQPAPAARGRVYAMTSQEA